MHASWKHISLTSLTKTIHTLTELRAKSWLCRGQPEQYGGLMPSIDRGSLKSLRRPDKLMRERKSINLFKATARFYMPGEEEALNEDVGALMVLRHYGVPTRLLDWSLSPFIAAYFAALGDANKDGEIWAFDHNLYVQEGSKQWEPFGGFKQAEAAAFLMSEPKRDWFVCYFYQHRAGFLRQKAQQGFCSMTPRFGCDHANAIADLLKSSAHCCRYVIDRRVKPKLRKVLQDEHGIWRGSLYPDAAGAADTATWIVFPERYDSKASPKS